MGRCPQPPKARKSLQMRKIQGSRRALRSGRVGRRPARGGAGRGAVLDASVALIDRSSAVLAVAGASPDQEQKLLSGGEGVTAVELRVADTAVGELRYRAKAAARPGDRPHGDDAAGAGAGALALAGVGERGGGRASSSPPCSPAR